MVTGECSRWGREEGVSTCRYWRLGRVLTSPYPAAVQWSVPGAGSRDWACHRPGMGELSGMILGAWVHRRSPGYGALEIRCRGERAVRMGDFGDDWGL